MEKEMKEELNKITQKLFNKDVDKVKYLMCTNYVHKQLIEGEDCVRTGLYSWIPVFDGEVKSYTSILNKSDLQKYDIIHVNLSGQDMHLVGEIRESLGDNPNNTQIVANNDYTVELWQGSFDYLPTMKREMSHADVLFGTEPYQVGALELLTGRNIHLITHPCFVKRLKTLKPRQKTDMLSVVWHRYDNYAIVPSMAIKDMNRPTRLIGYDSEVDRKKYVTSCHYNYLMPATNYMDFCEQLMESELVVDPFTLTSQSRTGWDCAALGVPMIGSNRNESVRQCFPFTMCDPYDIKTMRKLVEKVLKDKEFRQKVIDYAKEQVEIVNYDNSKYKLIKALEVGSKKN